MPKKSYTPKPGTAAEAIHDYILSHPDDKRPIQIMEGLAPGTKVSSAQVCQVQRQMHDAGKLPYASTTGAKKTDADKIRAYLAQHPNSSPADVAKATGAKIGNVYSVKSADNIAKKKAHATKKKAGKKRKAGRADTNGFGAITSINELATHHGLAFDALKEIAESLNELTEASGHEHVISAIACLEQITPASDE